MSDKKAAVFGSGDTSYPQFCAAVDILMNKLAELGAEIILDGLKIELTPSKEDQKQCRDFGNEFATYLLEERERDLTS